MVKLHTPKGYFVTMLRSIHIFRIHEQSSSLTSRAIPKNIRRTVSETLFNYFMIITPCDSTFTKKTLYGYIYLTVV